VHKKQMRSFAVAMKKNEVRKRVSDFLVSCCTPSLIKTQSAKPLQKDAYKKKTGAGWPTLGGH